jgi:hypothetical protein
MFPVEHCKNGVKMGGFGFVFAIRARSTARQSVPARLD